MRGMLSIHAVLGFILIISISPCLCAEPNESINPVKQSNVAEQIKRHIYKRTPQGELEIFTHLPNAWKSTDKRPAIVFFFGGAFRTGTIKEFTRHAEYLASRGMVTVRADYRVKDRHGTMPDKCVEDAKSAVRWLRSNAHKLGIDPNRIAASGNSAGGHMAACASTTIGLEAEGEDLSISSKPNLLVLFNSSLDISWKYGEYLGSEETRNHLSPNDNLTADLSPAILFYGVLDTHLWYGLAFAYKSAILGNTVELYAAEGLWHNDSKYSPWFENTVYLMDQFLAKHGYLEDEPTISLPQDKVEIGRMTSKDFSLMDSLNHTPLHVAALSGDIELTESLIANGIDVNAKDRWRLTPLLLAIGQSGDMEVIQALIDAGADLNGLLAGGAPLHHVARNGHTALAALLISNGADVNLSMGGEPQWTPLHIAIQQGRQEMVELLLAQRASVHSSGYLGQTPIETAMQAKHTKIEIVELLLSKGADIPPLHLALYSKERAKVKDLIEAGADVNEQTPYGTTPLQRAVIVNDFADIVRLLIENGANVNTKDHWGWSPLHSAAEQGRQDLVELLIAKDANVNAGDGDERTPLWYAQEEGYTEIVKLLRKQGAKEQAAVPSHSLHMAAANGDIEQVKKLISEGADVNARDGSKQTALHEAARYGHKETVEMLLAHGADVNARDRLKKTPVESCALGGHHREVVELLVAKGAEMPPLTLAACMGDGAGIKRLIENGADVNIRTQSGFTPLCFVAHQGAKDIVQRLVDSGADVNAKDNWNWNWTPLHSAAEKGYRDVAELLVAKGANVNARDGASRTPLYYAQEGDYTEIVELLCKQGAKE